MTNEIQATAPTPQDWIDLKRENERLKVALERKTKQSSQWRKIANDWYKDCEKLQAEIGVLKGESE